MTPKKQRLVVLGIDPGLADTGYGLIAVEKGRLEMIACGSIKTKKSTPLSDRLIIIEKNLDKIIKKYQPDVAGIEELFFFKNITTAMVVGEARGVAILTLAKNRLPIIELTPLQVKQGLTGYGRADKKQMQLMVKIILGLKEIPKPDDAADALAIAVCTSNYKSY